MDRLSSERQESLRKTSSERLRFKLVRAGMDEEKIVGMDQSRLLEEVAKTITGQQLEEGAQLTLPTDENGSVAYEAGSEALRMRELEIEEKR